MAPLILAAALAAGEPTVKPPEPTYLVILGRPEEFSAEYPARGPGSARHVGWGMMLFTLTTPVSGLRQQVEEALDTTERTGYPLLLHLDDWNFPPQSTDPEWVEWTDWPKAGEANGPLVRRRWVNWGTWIVTGPPPNYESLKFREFVRSQVEEGVINPVVARLGRWREEGREYLFAGLVVGWESGYYSMPRAPEPRPASGEATFEEDEAVTTGYAVLTARGYTGERLAGEAKARGMSEDALFRELMCGVVHDYTEYLCRICVEGGIPRERVYTHYTAYATVASPEQIAEDGRLLPVATAVNPYSRPGLTMTWGWAAPEKVVSELQAAGCHEWGAVEIEIVPNTRDEEAALGQLEWLASHGARVLCIFGWWEPEGHMFAVRGDRRRCRHKALAGSKGDTALTGEA